MTNPATVDEAVVAKEPTVAKEAVEDITFPDASQLVTEDDRPVDNFASAKQQRLLVSSLYSSLPSAVFLAEANVGVYHNYGSPPIVPDVFVSFDVEVPSDWWDKPNRCYLVWNFGKAPDVVVEIVSNKIGNELETKLHTYENMRASYYVLYDPSGQLGNEQLRVFELRGGAYFELSEFWLEHANFGVTIWEGKFEGRDDSWLRWCDREGNVFLTGDEIAERESQRAEQESQRADRESQRADRLAELLKAQGIDPNQLPDA